MALQRETIYAAILTKLQGVAGWATVPSRRGKDLSELDATAQPTAFLLDSQKETATFVRGRALVWTLYPEILVYARTDDLTAAPGSVINPILTAIESAFEDGGTGGPSPTTLGQLVQHCRIVSMDIGAGHLGGQAVAQVNLEVLGVA